MCTKLVVGLHGSLYHVGKSRTFIAARVDLAFRRQLNETLVSVRYRWHSTQHGPIPILTEVQHPPYHHITCNWELWSHPNLSYCITQKCFDWLSISLQSCSYSRPVFGPRYRHFGVMGRLTFSSNYVSTI